jgi:hypothetical protein
MQKFQIDKNKNLDFLLDQIDETMLHPTLFELRVADARKLPEAR